MLEFFNFDKKIFFCLPGLRKNFQVAGGGNNRFFFGKNHTCFFGTRPHKKKGGESIFKGIFRIWKKKFEKKIGRRKAGTTEGKNNGTRNDTTSVLFKNLVYLFFVVLCLFGRLLLFVCLVGCFSMLCNKVRVYVC